LSSGENKFSDFPENQMSKFHAEFPNFMQNLPIYWQGCGPKTGGVMGRKSIAGPREH